MTTIPYTILSTFYASESRPRPHINLLSLKGATMMVTLFQFLYRIATDNALNDYGAGARASEVEVTVEIGPPLVPRISLASISSSTMTISVATDGSDALAAAAAKVAGDEYKLLPLYNSFIPTTSSEITFDRLDPATKYNFTVRSKNGRR